MVKQTQDIPPRPTPPRGIREVKDGIPSKKETFGLEPKYPWPNTPYETLLLNKVLELESEQDKLPWYPFLIGVAAGNLIWTFIFKVFGG